MPRSLRGAPRPPLRSPRDHGRGGGGPSTDAADAAWVRASSERPAERQSVRLAGVAGVVSRGSLRGDESCGDLHVSDARRGAKRELSAVFGAGHAQRDRVSTVPHRELEERVDAHAGERREDGAAAAEGAIPRLPCRGAGQWPRERAGGRRRRKTGAETGAQWVQVRQSQGTAELIVHDETSQITAEELVRRSEFASEQRNRKGETPEHSAVPSHPNGETGETGETKENSMMEKSEKSEKLEKLGKQEKQEKQEMIKTIDGKQCLLYECWLSNGQVKDFACMKVQKVQKEGKEVFVYTSEKRLVLTK